MVGLRVFVGFCAVWSGPWATADQIARLVREAIFPAVVDSVISMSPIGTANAAMTGRTTYLRGYCGW